jgi:hypothetical protein
VALLRAILKPGTPGSRLFSLESGPAPTLSAQAVKQSVSPGKNFTIAIVADRPTDRIEATVEVTRVFAAGRKDTQTMPLRYQGGPVRTIPLLFTAPDERAALVFSVRQAAGYPEGDQASVLVIG